MPASRWQPLRAEDRGNSHEAEDHHQGFGPIVVEVCPKWITHGGRLFELYTHSMSIAPYCDAVVGRITEVDEVEFRGQSQIGHQQTGAAE
jgi:hypothetical protein